MVRQYGTPPSTPGQEENEKKYGRDRRDGTPKTKAQDPAPSNKDVERLHTNASVDTKKKDMHHTIGPGENQAASGAHTHNGSDSPRLLDGVVITGAKGGNAALASAISALVKLGATDSTTA